MTRPSLYLTRFIGVLVDAHAYPLDLFIGVLMMHVQFPLFKVLARAVSQLPKLSVITFCSASAVFGHFPEMNDREARPVATVHHNFPARTRC